MLHYERQKLGSRKISRKRVGGKRLEFNNPFCKKTQWILPYFIQSFSVEIRPNKQFVHSRVDGAVD
jgi:hypothetical protein